MTIPQLTMYESVVIVTVFSVLVIVADEVMHARRRKRKQAEGGSSRGH